ncbi:MAG: CPBP family intramembrane metalloprotease [Anaerolineae bacterium]
MKAFLRTKVRPVAITVTAPAVGFLLLFVLGMFLETEFSKLFRSIVNLVVVALMAFVVFPRYLGIPFGRVETKVFLRQVGFTLPENAWKHLGLGLVLAGCTLSGMLVASLLTGKYAVDRSTVDLPHLVFSLNPALWEELFYRGVLMIVLLEATHSLKKASVVQVILFGLMHIKGTDVRAVVEMFSVAVLALGFTYVAYKTRSLVAGIVFHYLHDALLFFVQLPDGVDTGVTGSLLFYGLLWLAVGAGCLITKLAADRLGVQAAAELYRVERIDAGRETLQATGKSQIGP